MTFADEQVRKLKRKPRAKDVKERTADGKTLHYIEGWYAIDQANKIFGYDAWDRRTLHSACVHSRHVGARFVASYITRVCITVRAGASVIRREGCGAGEATASTPGAAHEMAAKAAETDATKRALATFGSPFGLSLYSAKPRPNSSGQQETSQSASGHQHKTPPCADTGKAVDKSALALSEPKRLRNKYHLQEVASRACVVCGRRPCDAHHLTFAQPKAMQRKVSDEFVVPVCRLHHSELHQSGNEEAWWESKGVKPLLIAERLWNETRDSAATNEVLD
jgi:hypothetical protein